MEIHSVTDGNGALAAPEWLMRAEGVHRQLRERLPPDYAATMRRVFAGGGRMCVAARGERVLGVAVYRIHENTVHGPHLYMDDLVTDADARSTGVGAALLRHCERVARAAGCAVVTLDSGTPRHRAHRFYLREGFDIVSFSFRKTL